MYVYNYINIFSGPYAIINDRPPTTEAAMTGAFVAPGSISQNLDWNNKGSLRALSASAHTYRRVFRALSAIKAMSTSVDTITSTVRPQIIESLWAKKRVSIGALRALDDPLVVQTNI